MGEIETRPPCGCCVILDGLWVPSCDCMNSGNLSNAQAWCTERNTDARIAALEAEVERLTREAKETASYLDEHTPENDIGCGCTMRPLPVAAKELREEVERLRREAAAWAKIVALHRSLEDEFDMREVGITLANLVEREAAPLPEEESAR